MKRYLETFLGLLLLPVLLWSADLKTLNVMAPLHVMNYNDPTRLEAADWTTFGERLETVKELGADAVSTDVWWGLVEAQGDNEFDWSYYHQVADAIKLAGLHWVPILSFHQCGGNVGDDCDIPLPQWLWAKLVQSDPDITKEQQLQFVSSGNQASREYVAFWSDALVMPEYEEVMRAFKAEFSLYLSIIDEVNVALGPSGELRYPSYNAHDGGGYPKRGELQAYSDTARADFRAAMLEKYGSFSRLNRAWGLQLGDPSQINPPDNSDFFFTHRDYINTQYGRDLVDWYNVTLARHGARMLTLADTVFQDAFAAVPLGFKIPGVHWRIGDPQMPRVAEVTAGLIRSYDNLYEKGYMHTLRTLLGDTGDFKKRLLLHFTCLEMDDGGNVYPYERPKSLVFWVAKAADELGLPIKGENALNGGIKNDRGWDNIQNAFDYASYSGLTVLRMDDIVTDETARRRFKAFAGRH